MDDLRSVASHYLALRDDQESPSSEDFLREEGRNNLYGFLGSVFTPNYSDGGSWRRYYLHEHNQEATSRLTRLLHLASPLFEFFPQIMLEDIISRMLVCPHCKSKQTQTTYLQMLAFVESYLRTHGESLTFSLVKQIQAVLSIPLSYHAISVEYGRLKRSRAPLYPSCSTPKIIKGMIGQALIPLAQTCSII
ncbi:MAG: hypothetical protein ACFFC7_35120 [Candidatus Hermodarchaeota archaeon]